MACLFLLLLRCDSVSRDQLLVGTSWMRLLIYTLIWRHNY
jgi:hypothetical protein